MKNNREFRILFRNASNDLQFHSSIISAKPLKVRIRGAAVSPVFGASYPGFGGRWRGGMGLVIGQPIGLPVDSGDPVGGAEDV